MKIEEEKQIKSQSQITVVPVFAVHELLVVAMRVYIGARIKVKVGNEISDGFSVKVGVGSQHEDVLVSDG